MKETVAAAATTYPPITAQLVKEGQDRWREIHAAGNGSTQHRLAAQHFNMWARQHGGEILDALAAHVGLEPTGVLAQNMTTPLPPKLGEALV